MHMRCCDITYDVTASFNDVTPANKMTQDDKNNVAMVHPECWVFHTMPHPPPCIWARPHNQSLQPLYLSTITTTMSFITNKSSNIFRRISSMAMQGPPAGLCLRGCPALPHQHAPWWCLCQWLLPASIGSRVRSRNPLGWPPPLLQDRGSRHGLLDFLKVLFVQLELSFLEGCLRRTGRGCGLSLIGFQFLPYLEEWHCLWNYLSRPCCRILGV